MTSNLLTENLFTKQSGALTTQNFSILSEQNLIAACLTENRFDMIREISLQLIATDFFNPVHQNIWRCRSSLADAGVAHDVAAVIDTGRKLRLDLGGVEYVMGLLGDETHKAASDTALRSSAKRVKDLSILRTFTETLDIARGLSLSGTGHYEEVINYVADSIENIRASKSTRATGPIHVAHYVSGVVDAVMMRMDGGAPTSSVTTGFSGLDRLTGGMVDGDLVVLAARPSMGKTAVSLALSEGCASIGERDVLYFSTEQSGTALAYRMIASKARIDATDMRRGVFKDGDFDRFDDGAREVGDLRLHIDETSPITLPEIRARARIFAKRHPKMLVVVDYLQRIDPHRIAEPKIIVAEITRGLKELAKELKCPVLALAQLNRGPETRANKRPMLSDLGDSGKIEQDADVIMFLYRDDYYNPDTREPGVTEVIVAKNRDGAIGVVKLLGDKRTQHYEEMYAN